MSINPDVIVDRALGSLVGLAVGDALGTTFEAGSRRDPAIRLEMVGDGPHHLQPGQWTDDTAMALCLAESLIATGGRVKHRDLMETFGQWMTEGRNSCTGTAFDIGWTTRGSISEYLETDQPITGPTGRDGAGNGGIMRLAPAVLANLNQVDLAARAAVEQSRTTHGAPQCLEAADLMARIVHGLINADDPHQLPEKQSGVRYAEREVADIAYGRYRDKPREAIRTTGYVIHTLEASLWSFSRHGSFENVLTEAINLGGDTDTTGAVAGQIAGAAYGLSAIPERWLTDLAWRDEIIARGRALIEVSNAPPKTSMFRNVLSMFGGRS
jgi:ADP-ribosyl-[dinitrogen reductase] hydrolase